jgi:hypothetical protein
VNTGTDIYRLAKATALPPFALQWLYAKWPP